MIRHFCNLLVFNEGYHQEHHLQPGMHWSRRPELREKYADPLETSNRVISKLPPLLGWLDRSRPVA